MCTHLVTSCFEIHGTCHHFRIFLGSFRIFFWCSDVSTCVGTHTLDTMSLFLTTLQLWQLLDTISTDPTDFDTYFWQKTYRVDNFHNFSNQAVSNTLIIEAQLALLGDALTTASVLSSTNSRIQHASSVQSKHLNVYVIVACHQKHSNFQAYF